MTDKTEIKIEGDSIIYNGVKYEKVKKVPSEQPLKLQYMFADILENVIADLANYDDVMNSVDYIATTLLEEMRQYVPDYSDWEDAFKELPVHTYSPEDVPYFKKGWNAYCKKMWDMINDD
jgi:hypothetical protein